VGKVLICFVKGKEFDTLRATPDEDFNRVMLASVTKDEPTVLGQSAQWLKWPFPVYFLSRVTRPGDKNKFEV
jgi:hypothetical protein